MLHLSAASFCPPAPFISGAPVDGRGRNHGIPLQMNEFACAEHIVGRAHRSLESTFKGKWCGQLILQFRVMPLPAVAQEMLSLITNWLNQQTKVSKLSICGYLIQFHLVISLPKNTGSPTEIHLSLDRLRVDFSYSNCMNYVRTLNQKNWFSWFPMQ